MSDKEAQVLISLIFRQRSWRMGEAQREYDDKMGRLPPLDDHTADWWDGYAERPFREER